MIKKYKGEIISFYILALISIICASFFDLKLDIMLNNPDQGFSLWFQGMGEMPCRLVPPLAGVVIYKFCDKPVLKCFGIFSNIAGSAHLGYHIANYFFIEDNHKTVFGLLLGLCFGAFLQYFAQFIEIKEEYRKPLVILAFAGLSVMFVQIGAIEIIKALWGRVRFRDLKGEVNYESFTAWYHPNGINGNKSFPSGHTASAAMSYLLMLMPNVSEKWEKRKVLCFILPLIFTSVVAFTRLVMGAHYLSDVTMGGTIGFTVTIIAMKILDKKYFNSCNLEKHNV
ncbi:MAG: phosphatase PAP2 family protein [Eubacterium sp.]|nr:phosphatase PAP2 family protein [Eubacterium sp.]